MRDSPNGKQGCLPEIHYAVVMGVALDEKFYIRCSILDGDGRGWSSEINHIPRCLVLPLFATFTDIKNGLTTRSFQFQRELQGPFWSRAFLVH